MTVKRVKTNGIENDIHGKECDAGENECGTHGNELKQPLEGLFPRSAKLQK